MFNLLKKMTEEEKEKYRLKATSRSVNAVSTVLKYTTLGESVADIEKRERETFEQQKYMERMIRRFIGFSMQNNGKQMDDC